MGGLLIKNKELRCPNCFNLYSIKIKPEYPGSKITKTCNCSTSEMEMSKFLAEYKKNKNLSISCSNCKKSFPAKYCHQCKKLYCGSCSKSIHSPKGNNKDHNLIVIDKYDFFCIMHQIDNFCAYCQTCKINLCLKCGQANIHNGHQLILFHEKYDERKMRDYYKQAIKFAENKIEYNKKFTNIVTKELKKNKEMAKNVKTIGDFSDEENRKILELINIFYELYDICKPKNLAIIENMFNNLNFNLEKIKYDKNLTVENNAENFINYLKTDFILKTEEKPKEVPSNLEEQFFNDEFNKFNEEEKKEGEKEGNPEEKKDEEKKEENIEEGNKEEEKKEEDDGHVKTLKEKKLLIEKKINEKGGFQHVEANPITTKNNGIIKDPKGTPEDVVKIISNQAINKNTN